MKRKLCALLLMITVAIFSVCSLSACGNDYGKLQMNEKYILRNDIHSADDTKLDYYVFHSKGRGEYRYRRISGSYGYDYTIKFKYTYADADKSTVVCFYDSIKFGDDHNQSKGSAVSWTVTLGVSKDVLISLTSNEMYVNEKYIKNIPNYNKSEQSA